MPDSPKIMSPDITSTGINSQDKKQQSHRKKMAKLKDKVDKSTAQATEERGLLILLTGKGKGKSSSAFGMVMRALGYGQKVGIVQFIKGAQLSGEELYVRDHHPEIPFYQMGTGFTWDTQDRDKDIAAAVATWAEAVKMLKDKTLDLVILDELTYMLAYQYLNENQVLSALKNRPPQQSVVVTGRGGGRELKEMADTVSEVKEVKHAFHLGIKARKGVDY